MRHFVLLFSAAMILSCKQETKVPPINSKEIKVSKIDTIEKEFVLFSKTITPNKSFVRKGIEVYAEQLYLDNEDTFAFVPLYFKEGYTYKTVDSVVGVHRKLLFEKDEEGRYKLGDSIAETYLETEKLDKLLLVNKNQEIVDTLSLVEYGTYHDALNEYYTAVYKLPENYDKSLIYNVISADSLDLEDLRISQDVVSNEAYAQTLINRNDFKYDHLYSNYHFINKNDTISLVAFGDYKNSKECQYLLKNGVPTDSIINDYFIDSMTPIPLATDTEVTFITYNGVPESDVSWTGLLSIDLEDLKFIFHQKNTMER